MTMLNIAHSIPTTKSLGPGLRFGLWVQGCPFNCPDCISPDWIPLKKANLVEVNVLTEIIASQENINGITISGGEPMLQAGRLALLLDKIKEIRHDLNTIVFTGFRREQLIWDEAMALLKNTDLLIDGQYISAKNDSSGLRGSNNQRFHFLSEKLLPWKTEITTERPDPSFHLLEDGVLMTGIPSNGFNFNTQWGHYRKLNH